MNKIGQTGEKVAANYLISQGYQIIDANQYNHTGYRLGEIDLIAKEKGGAIVFFEVKSRKGKKNSVVPEESITAGKIRKIIKAAEYYLRKNKLFGVDWRIDAIGIVFDFHSRKMDITHTKNIRAD